MPKTRLPNIKIVEAYTFVLTSILYAGVYLVFSTMGVFSSAPFIFPSEELYVLDRISVYVLCYYTPFIIAYVFLKNIIKNQEFEKPCLFIYLLQGFYLFFSDKYMWRGLEVHPQFYYFLLLLIPVVCLGFLIHLRRLHKKRQTNHPLPSDKNPLGTEGE